MSVFVSTIDQMAFLLFLIVIGYIITKLNVISSSAAGILSKLENTIFIPALVLGTFMNNFTIKRIGVAGQYFLVGFVVILISIPVAIVVSKLFTKDDYICKIYTYGLSFSNFGFMGNAVVKALFPDVFMDYLIFVLPFWIMIYMWGVPALLIPSDKTKKSLLSRIKPLLNPMFIAMIIGMLIGVSGITIPSFLSNSVTTLGDCMSPIAMLLTGITVASIDLKKTFTNVPVYLLSIIRLIVFPLLFTVILIFVDIPYGLALCALCSLAMPLGLNTIVVPSAYGKDTSVAAGMALISHLLSCVTIPIVFMIFDYIINGG